MKPFIDETHDPALRSWVASANTPDTDFPLQNLPFGRFRDPSDSDWSIGVAIGGTAAIGVFVDHDAARSSS